MSALNANDMCLHFNDPLVRIRKLRVNIGKEGMSCFTVFSEVEIPTQRVPAAACAISPAKP